MPLDNPQVGTTQHTPKPHLLLLFWLRNILTKMLIVGEVGNMTESRSDSGFVLYTPLPWPNQLPFPHPRRCPTPQITASWAHLTSAHKNTHTHTITIIICAHKMLPMFSTPAIIELQRFVIQREFQTGLWIQIKTLLFHWAFGCSFWLLFCVFQYICSFCAQK
jgi:hypothetical protein